MKNLFFVSVAFSIFSGTSLTAHGQKSYNFKDGIDLVAEAEASDYENARPVNFRVNSFLSREDEKLPFGDINYSALQFKYAQLLNREIESLSNLALYNFIDEWYGIRYRYGGTTKRGIDCSSLTGRIMKTIYSVELPRTAREQYAVCTKISGNQLSEGDLVFFNTRGGISHVGFFLGNGYFVHASSSSGVVISHMDDTYYRSRFIGAGRINPFDFSKIFM